MLQNKSMKKALSMTLAILLLATMFTVMLQGLKAEPVYALNEIYYSDDYYSDGNTSTTVTETFAYSSKQTVAIKSINTTFPAYYNTNNNLSNACANVAGANVIGYFDRFYVDLIPNHTPGIARGQGYSYYPMASNTALKQAVIDDLYVRMSTNIPEPGTTQADYKAGISSYVSNVNNLTVSYSSVMTNSALDFDKVDDALDNGYPISFFFSGYNVSQMTDSGSSVTITKNQFTGNHIAVIYGYKTIEYYDANGAVIKSKTYFYMSSGMSLNVGYYLYNNNGTINDAESVNIS